MQDLRQNCNYSEYMKLLGWKIYEIDGVYCYVRKIPIVGKSIVKIQRPDSFLKESELKKIAKLSNAFVIYVEPSNKKQQEYFNKKGYKISKSPLLPTKTTQIDLTKDMIKLLGEMHHKTRYNIKLSQRLVVKVKRSKNIIKFAEFWQSNALKRGMFLPMKKEIVAINQAFGKKATILNAYHIRKKVAALLLIDTDEISYYMYATSTKEGKKSNAPTLLVWQALKIAKKRGRKLFDFEGIYDERFPIKSWRGFTRFKKSFGGEEIEYPGTLRKYFFILK